VKSSFDLVMGCIDNTKNIWNKVTGPKKAPPALEAPLAHSENLEANAIDAGAGIVDADADVPPAQLPPPEPQPKTWGEFFYKVGTTGGFFALRVINATVATIIASQNALTGAMSSVAMTGAGLRAYSAVSSVGGEITYNRVIDDVAEEEIHVDDAPPPARRFSCWK
jgi:hypothetical protein